MGSLALMEVGLLCLQYLTPTYLSAVSALRVSHKCFSMLPTQLHMLLHTISYLLGFSSHLDWGAATSSNANCPPAFAMSDDRINKGPTYQQNLALAANDVCKKVSQALYFALRPLAQ